MSEKILITPRSYGKTQPGLFERLKQAGFDLVVNETGGILTKEQMIREIGDCAGVILGIDPMDADVIAAAPKLRAIAKYGVGTDNIDLQAAAARGITVSRTDGANNEAVADYAMALMLALSRRILDTDRQCREDDWSKVMAFDVSHKTLGLFGLGAIGKGVVKRARGFSMRILANDINWDENYAAENGIKRADPEEIFKHSDFISLHLPLTQATRNFVGADQLAIMKKNAVLINTARGGLIDGDALLSALKEGRILGAGLDVFEPEPPTNKEWFGLPNVILSAHCAASTHGAAERMGEMATDNLLRDIALT